MKDLIETLYPMDRYLLGAGYDNALNWISQLIKLNIVEIPSGTQVGTWTVPNEWVVKEAWVKNKKTKEKIIDIKDNPLKLVVGSRATKETIKLEYLIRHLNYIDEQPDSIPYIFNYYGNNWGFCVKKNDIFKLNDKEKTQEDEFLPKYVNSLPDDDYEVFIDSETKPGKLKIGVHTIPGKTKREILLFAHLDHPFQANDNLSGVACLVDLATKIKSDYTIKVIFCPETIGSTAYALTQDISNVEFVIAVDICGNDNTLLLQKSFVDSPLNSVAHVAIHSLGESYRKAPFRSTIGSDEYVFNDPQLNIPAIMLSRHPYKEYHTSDDKPEKIDYTKIEETQKAILKIIEVYEKNYIPTKIFKGQLFRSKYGIQSESPQLNLAWDYLIYNINGRKSLAELCCDFSLPFDKVHEVFNKLKEDGKIGISFNASEVR